MRFSHRGLWLLPPALGLVSTLTGCVSSDPYAHLRDTRVGREQLVLTGNPELDPYFASIWEIQRTLSAADLRRADALAQVATVLGLHHDATPDRIGTTLRHQLTTHQIDSVDVSVDQSRRTFEILNDWVNAVARAPDRTSDTRFVELEASLMVTVEFHGTEPDAMRPVGVAMETVLRRSNALQAAMEGIGPLGPSFVTRGQDFLQRFPRWRGELLAAVRFARSILPMATAQAEESHRTTVWARAALTPDH